jgi:hypothetical protein
MGPREAVDTVRIILYITAFIFLLIAAYMLYLRRYRRGTLEALNNVTFVTSRYDKYSAKSQFLVDLPNDSKIILKVLDQSENPVKDLLNGEFEAGQHTIMFNPAEFQNGIYYLSLQTDNANVLRKITIENQA